MALVDIANGKSRHVHYRDSKLTFLLRVSEIRAYILGALNVLGSKLKYQEHWQVHTVYV